MSDTAPLFYVILGAAGSGRREVLVDWIREGLDADEKAVVYLSEKEPAGPHDSELGEVVRWRWAGDAIDAPLEPLAGATHVFFVTDGRGNPVDQMEAIKPWWQTSGTEIGRVYTFVNCQLASAHPPLSIWYDACIHFSDAVLLNFREGVPNKWLSDFQSRYKDLFYPCLFEFVKGGKVKNPPLMLEPEARRMSHLFDETVWLDENGDDIESGSENDEGVEQKEDEEIELVAEVDPWMERRAGGRRLKEIPDVASFLPPL